MDLFEIKKPSTGLSNKVSTSASTQTTVSRPVTRETVVNKARDAKKSADEDYQQIASIATVFFTGAKNLGSISLKDLERIQTRIVRFFKNYESSLLLECLQVVRDNRMYYPCHALNVSLYNAMIGSFIGLDEAKLNWLVKLGFVIDLGMMLLPSHLLERNNVLSDEDRVTLQSHPLSSVQLLVEAGETDHTLLDAVRCHHERQDGTGYPQGLYATNLTLDTHITTISDTYDAATARKNYCKTKSPFDILAELYENKRNILEPGITEAAVAGFSDLLVGRYISLSDNSIGKIMKVNMDNLAYPVVRVVNKHIQTHPGLYPVALSGHVPLY